MQESNKDGKPELGKNDIDVAKEHFKIQKSKLIDLVQAYKQRKFDEDIVACD
jgi:hypothetical protein